MNRSAHAAAGLAGWQKKLIAGALLEVIDPVSLPWAAEHRAAVEIDVERLRLLPEILRFGACVEIFGELERDCNSKS